MAFPKPTGELADDLIGDFWPQGNEDSLREDGQALIADGQRRQEDAKEMLSGAGGFQEVFGGKRLDAAQRKTEEHARQLSAIGDARERRGKARTAIADLHADAKDRIDRIVRTAEVQLVAAQAALRGQPAAVAAARENIKNAGRAAVQGVNAQLAADIAKYKETPAQESGGCCGAGFAVREMAGWQECEAAYQLAIKHCRNLPDKKRRALCYAEAADDLAKCRAESDRPPQPRPRRKPAPPKPPPPRRDPEPDPQPQKPPPPPSQPEPQQPAPVPPRPQQPVPEPQKQPPPAPPSPSPTPVPAPPSPSPEPAPAPTTPQTTPAPEPQPPGAPQPSPEPKPAPSTPQTQPPGPPGGPTPTPGPWFPPLPHIPEPRFPNPFPRPDPRHPHPGPFPGPFPIPPIPIPIPVEDPQPNPPPEPGQDV
ncbi:MAG: hypothetical protein ACRC20_09600 [Segniliparus sp.]|uniref:hypothetical protein n=1 Tax=Segniliparus sp. TaxID=2804064 RepID=UPI003F33BAA8